MSLLENLPENFVWGVATSAYQIEGAAFEDGRGPSIWDTFCRTEGKVYQADNGDVACNHYHLWQEDLDLIKTLGVDAYRFSIAWPRVIPEGLGSVNQKGLDFYDRLVDGMLERNLTPYATLYHWDLPQALEDKGGWVNRDTAYAFAEYADVVTKRLGDRVASYATLNEPWCSAYLGYGNGHHAPGIQDEASYLQAAHHLLLAHGLAMPIMRSNAPKAEHGIVLNYEPAYSLDSSEEEIAVAERYEDFYFHWFMQPLLKGSYPEKLLEYFADSSPTIVDGDLQKISQAIDFLGMNYYTSVATVHDSKEWLEIGRRRQDEAKHTAMDWAVTPHALYELLKKLDASYDLPKLYITENGGAFPDVPDSATSSLEIKDDDRIAYFEQHIGAVLKARAEGVPVEGYFAWSLMDNFEWAFGYEKRFGIVHVDYATQQRTLKASAKWYQALLDTTNSTGTN